MSTLRNCLNCWNTNYGLAAFSFSGAHLLHAQRSFSITDTNFHHHETKYIAHESGKLQSQRSQAHREDRGNIYPEQSFYMH